MFKNAICEETRIQNASECSPLLDAMTILRLWRPVRLKRSEDKIHNVLHTTHSSLVCYLD